MGAGVGLYLLPSHGLYDHVCYILTDIGRYEGARIAVSIDNEFQ